MEKITAESIAQWVLDNRYSKGEFQTMHASEMYNIIVEKVNEFSSLKSQSDNRELVEKIEIMIREYEGRRDYEKGFNDTKYLLYNRVAHDLKKLIS